MTLFWAEMYFISIDRRITYKKIFRPAIIIINILAFILLYLLTFIISESWKRNSYIAPIFSIGLSIAYILSAIIFGFFSYVAISELRMTPVPLITRTNRVNQLRLLALVYILSLIGNSIITPILAYYWRHTHTNGINNETALFFYFFLSELLPIFMVLRYYSISNVKEILQNDIDELRPLNSNPNEPEPYSTTPATGPEHIDKKFLRFGSRGIWDNTKPLLKYYKNKEAPASLLDEIIQKLSNGHQ